MRNKLAGNSYERLNSRERVIMIVKAMARDDGSEVQRLYDSAPIVKYRAVDWNFEGAYDAIQLLTFMLGLQLQYDVGRLHVAQMLAGLAPTVIDLTADEIARRSAVPKSNPQDTRSAFGEAHALLWDEWACEASAILISFDRFMRRLVDLDAMTVLRAWLPLIADQVVSLKIMQHDPDAYRLEQWGQVWALWWNRLMGGRLNDKEPHESNYNVTSNSKPTL